MNSPVPAVVKRLRDKHPAKSARDTLSSVDTPESGSSGLMAKPAEKFRQLLDESLAGVFIHRGHKPVYVNAAWARLHGYTVEEVMQADSVVDLMHPDDRERVRNYYYQRQRNEDVPSTYDYRALTGTGETRTLQIHVSLIEWEGEVASYGTVIDVTAEREAAAEMKAGQRETKAELRLLAAAVSQSRDGLTVCRANEPGCPTIFANPSFSRITGYDTAEVIGQSCSILHGPATSRETVAEIRRCLASGEVFSGEILNYRKDGEAFWNMLTISPLRNDQGEIEFFVGTQMDITGRVLNRREIERNRSALGQTVDRICFLDQAYRYVYANNALCEAVGRSAEDIIGLHVRDILGNEYFENHSRPVIDIALAGTSVTRQFDMLNKDGKPVRIEYTVSPFVSTDGGINGVSMVGRDITGEYNTRQALAMSETRFRDFAGLGADYFWETDAHGKFSYYSEEFERWLFPGGESLKDVTLPQLLSKHLKVRDFRNFVSRFADGLEFSVEFNVSAPAGKRRVIRLSGRATDPDDPDTGYRGIGQDLSASRIMEERLAWQASHDDLTGLINRREFEAQIRASVELAMESGARQSLLFLDLDHLKIVNDTCGHAAGDRLLRQVTEFLAAQVEKKDAILGRLGGDEFAILVTGESSTAAEDFARSLVDDAHQLQYSAGTRNFMISFSIGVVHLADGDVTIEQALASADVACYQAKAQGRNRISVYSEEDEVLIRQRRVNRMEGEIRAALEEERFDVFLQPIIGYVDNAAVVDKFEVLARMRDRDGNIVNPGDFIDAAEAYGLITEVDRYMVERSIALLADAPDDVRVAINLSGQTFADITFADHIEQCIVRAGIAGSRLTFEITETSAISGRDAAIRLIERVRGFGCRIALDDFGSGLSSFRYLKDFNVDELKIDGSFIVGIENDSANQVFVQAMANVASALEMTVTAEWVENEAAVTAVRRLGVDFLQGFLFGRPEPAAVALRQYRNACPVNGDQESST